MSAAGEAHDPRAGDVGIDPGDAPVPGRFLDVDGAIFMLLPLASLQLAGFPVSELAMGLAVAVGLLRHSPSARPVPGWFSGLLALLVTWMTVVALLQGLVPVRRLAHFVLFALLAVLLARGRFRMKSVATGLALGLVIAGGVSLLGIGAAGYEGRLTGLFGDPNLAGYYLLSLGAVAMAYLPTGRRRAVFGVVVGLLLLLTLSRTSILAAGLAGVWIVAGRRVGPLVNLTLLGGLLYAVANVSDRVRNLGPFAERTGSDALRERIILLEHAQIESGSWLGNGPGTSRVLVEGAPFFFHNSYLALLNEGGFVAVALLITLGVGVLTALARRTRRERNLWLEGAVIAVATCSINLGEVLLELPAAVVLGASMYHALWWTTDRETPTASRSATPDLNR